MNPPDFVATSDGSSSISPKPTDSLVESAIHRLLAQHGLPSAEFHAHVGGRRVDVHLTGTPVVIECDGWTSPNCSRDPDPDRDRYLDRDHISDRDQVERNRRNDAEFAAHGWIVLRFTSREITTRPADVANRIRTALDRWASVSITSHRSLEDPVTGRPRTSLVVHPPRLDPGATARQ